MLLDAVELEIVSRKLSAVTDEMYFAIQRASRSAYVKEAADFATAILDLDGNVFAYPPSASFAFLVDCNFKTTIDAVPDVEPGDVIVTNDPYRSAGLATHLPDVNLIRPLFYRGRLAAYAWSFVHCADIGGAVPSSMSPALTEIFQEGLRIPPMKLFRGGEQNDDLIELIRMNSRVPDITVADLRAMAGALALGEARLAEVIDQIGEDAFRRNVRDIQDYAEKRARDILRQIPDGDYDFWDYMDDDLVSRIPVRIRVRMSVRDGHVRLDLSGTDPQVKTSYNVPSAGRRMYWLTFRLTGFITAQAPDIPKNAGIYRNISVINPPGTVLHAEFPDAVNLRASAPYRLFDSVGGALIKAVPDLMPAATGGTMVPFAFAETLDDGSRKVEVVQPLKAGMGAMRGRDGVDARDNSLNNMRNHPLETVEGHSALVVTEYDIRPDSGGPGKWRGGAGQMITIRSATDSGVVVARGMERLRFPPFGIFGGCAGATLGAIFNRGRPDERMIAKIHELHLAKGDTLTLLMPGGGGYGDPFKRDAGLVLDDVLDGFVTLQSARDDYGVVIRGGVVDEAATRALRAHRPEKPAQIFDFGTFRNLWEAIFDDPSMLELNRRLFSLRKASRHALRRKVFERVVPELADPSALDLTDALAQTELLRARFAEALEDLLPTQDAA
ncbi:hydantoinase B/oxoprolinase family protein [Mesorhizobium sp. 1B3]|uniref:hydantoinase B/oxoprolinase family protein n=1 Tax=Mesorhizobium sp. 1B3 TaxID=3243599 RepID=UPI003D999784